MEAIKLAIVKLCRLIIGLRLKTKKLIPKRTKAILLVGTSEVTVDFLLYINEIMQDFGDMKFFLLVSKETQKFAQAKLASHREKITLISRLRALYSLWDLIIFSDHSNTHWFHPSIPKIQSTHGIDAAKLLGPGDNYLYGRNSLDRKGNPLYDLMFVESSYNQDIFTRSNPVLNGKLVVVGNLRADELLEVNQKREMIRQDLNLQEKDQVLLICSTWGPKSLFQKFGTVLLDEIPEISKIYKVYLLIHPLNDRMDFPAQGAISKAMDVYKRNGMAKRVDPLVSPLPYLVAADVVLTDHSSLFLFYALLEKPYLFVPITENLMEESLIWKFYELQEKYNPNLPLGDQLDRAVKKFPAKEHEKLARLLVDERGHARQRIRAEIAKFL